MVVMISNGLIICCVLNFGGFILFLFLCMLCLVVIFSFTHVTFMARLKCVVFYKKRSRNIINNSCYRSQQTFQHYNQL